MHQINMDNSTLKRNLQDFEELKKRCLPIFEAEPSQTHDDASLWRYLRAFKEVDFAYKMIIKTNKWRQEMNIDKLSPISDCDLEKEMTSGKGILLSQRDNFGRPVIYISVKNHNAYERNMDATTKFIIYMIELAVRKCSAVNDNLCIVFDLKDFSMSNMDYQFVKQLINLLSRYYPERLGICLILNAPMIFYGCWAIIKPWLHDVTANKITFVNNNKQLEEYLDPNSIPQE